MDLRPVTLEGRHVRLEPLTAEHGPGLCEVGLDPELWRWIPGRMESAADMTAWIDEAIRLEVHGLALPFAIRRRGGDLVGSTRFANIDRANRRLEIGWTWLARSAQRTAINTEAKLLLLKHAFGELGCNRVEFKTDALNSKSRAALLGIGATEEGTLRSHMVTTSGRIRDSVYFSIIASEWPEVRHRLQQRLDRVRD
jgi:N-acetyltransferase